jgi:1-acyl-sn-glycerol-3-phosphate acyltransferase
MIILTFVRSLISVALYPFFTILCCLFAIVNLMIGNKKIENLIVQLWGHYTLKMFGVVVTEHGRENLTKGGCLYLFNHTSFFDIFVMHARLRGVRFGAKIELFKIPIFGVTMRKVGVLPIARDNRADVIKVYEQAQVRARNGEQFALSPEGSRNTSEVGLKPFKSGPFIFAIRSKIPIVPVVIKGALEVLPKGHFLPNLKRWKHTIEVHYLEKIQVDKYSIEQRRELSEVVRKRMLQEII